MPYISTQNQRLMFFALSKLLYFIIQPIVWLVVLVSWAYFTKNDKKRRSILRGCFWLVILMTNPFLSNRVYRAWEYPEVSMASLKDTFDVGILLGGYSDFEVYPAFDRLNYNHAANRFSETLLLYKRGIIKKILLTGGDGRLIGERLNEADKAKALLLQLGVPEFDILMENQSSNTRENAVFSKVVLEKQGLLHSKILLITSAFHMKRAMGCFKKVGIDFTPFPAHFFANRLQWDTLSTITPDSKAFFKWEKFMKEWIGYGVYWLQGYI
jgi:uncharacterized SAM-binding protein YcdF (DUF218 family)